MNNLYNYLIIWDKFGTTKRRAHNRSSS